MKKKQHFEEKEGEKRNCFNICKEDDNRMSLSRNKSTISVS